MPRTARKASASGIYHVITRGINKQTIFTDKNDYYHFLDTLYSLKQKSEFQLYAYCLMGNHIHLLVKEGEEPLGTLFKRLGTSYAQYFNLKHQRSGHVFQDRFLSEAVENEPYFWDVLRYICQNPVKAGLSKTPFDYPWLGCWKIAGDARLLDKHGLLESLGTDRLREFVSIPCNGEHLDCDHKVKMTDDEAREWLCAMYGCITPELISGWPILRRDEMIRKAVRAGISYRQLARLTGVSKTMIERIVKGK